MLRPFLNRSGDKFALPADGWFQLVPRGEYPLTIGERTFIQVIDDAALASMENRFAAEAGNVRVDFDHFSYDPEKSSEAAGWLNTVQVRTDGLWAQARFSDVGEVALSNGRFRFISPSWMPGDVESLGGGRIRPLRLDSAGLTNNPNMRGMAPLTNRDAFNALQQSAANPPAGDQADKQTTETMKLLNTKLGLSADAAETAALDALDKLINRATTAEASVQTLTTERDALKNRNGELLSEQIDADLDAHGIADEAKRAKLKPVLTAMTNRADRTSFLTEIVGKPEATPEGKQPTKPLTNRAAAKVPGDRSATEDPEKERAIAGAIKNRANELHSANRARGFKACFAQAEAEARAGKLTS